MSGGAEGDTKTIEKTLGEAASNLADVRENFDDKAKDAVAERIQESVADKGYHSNEVLCDLEASEIRSYIPEPKRGRRLPRSSARWGPSSAVRVDDWRALDLPGSRTS